MRSMKLLLMAGAVLASSGAIAKTAKKPSVDEKADELLRKMSSALAGLKTFEVETRQVMEVVTKEGQKIQGLGGSTLVVERPNKLRTDRMGPRGGATVHYDGKNISVYGKKDNLYATSPAPDNLDAMIDFARSKLSIDAPAADLINSDAYAVLMEDVVSGQYLGSEAVGDRTCHHLAYRGKETDWQIWIEDGASALPCRFVIVSKKEPGSPQYEVDTFNWKLNPKLPADAFVFSPPPDAAKIEFATVGDNVEKAKQPRQARKAGK